MSEPDLQRRLSEAQEAIRLLQEELTETNRGLIALTMELEKKNNEMAETSRQLMEAAKLATLGELTTNIAHELRIPLATLTLRIEGLLAETPPNTPHQRGLEIVDNELDRMNRMVTNLLAFGHRPYRQACLLDFRQELEKLLEFMQFHLDSNNIDVVRKFAPDVPDVPIDAQLLRQLFLNLFTNACDAMPQGGTLTICIGKRGNEEIVIEFSDTGTGIPPEYLAKVMEPFFTTKPEGEGTGLGLPICRRIVQEYRGVLDLVSEDGKGTTARVVLPVSNGE